MSIVIYVITHPGGNSKVTKEDSKDSNIATRVRGFANIEPWMRYVAQIIH